MRRRIILAGAALGAVVISGGAVAGLSAATAGKIATGIHAGPVDLGGLSPADAKSRLEREYLAPLKTPIVVQRRGERYALSAKEGRVAGDLDTTIDQALVASKKDNALEAAWRTVSGKHVDRDIGVPVSIDRDAVLRFVDRVRRGVDRPAENAELTFVDDRPIVSKSRDGMAVDRQKLAKLVTAAVQDPARPAITVPVRREAAKLSSAKIRKDHHTIVTVDRNTHVLRLFKGFKLEKKYSVAVGMQGLDTPSGTYTINDKQVDPSWHVPLSAWAGDLAGTVVPPGPTNPIKARWMGFFDGAGIHGTSDDASIGSSASHGCVRMHVSDVIDLYPRVPVGTTINVV